ncbi:MAG TPA: DUF3105 domain-containing protein [Solirubrobacteraceae bacterium]|nr:DUF3105 domain-containing protein [Solirubrobacteraceae bacterium]
MTRAGPRGRTSAPESRLARWLERLAILLASLALSVGLIILLSGFFAGRDKAGVSGTGTGPGQAFADLGHAELRPGQPRPAYDSNPPTSGAHVTRAVGRAGAPLSVDQLLSALQLGDVVILYGGGRPPAGLEQFARSVAPPFSPELAATGDAVILARRPGTAGVLALAWAHMLRVPQASDPALREFVGFWLGRGAPGASG